MNTSAPLNLLVLGGSAGSRALNEGVPRAIYKANRQGCRWNVVHQAGEGASATVRQLYQRFGVSAIVSEFFDNVPQRLAEADLAITRAGGTTLAELACVGTPAILVPYERASDDHQRANAAEFVRQHAAVVVDSTNENVRFDNRLATELVRCHQHADLRKGLSQGMRDLAKPHAARHVARLIYQIAWQHMLAVA